VGGGRGGACPLGKGAGELVCMPKNLGGLRMLDIERSGHALCLRWPWLQWKYPKRALAESKLPCDDVDMALFRASTNIVICNGRLPPSGTTTGVTVVRYLNGRLISSKLRPGKAAQLQKSCDITTGSARLSGLPLPSSWRNTLRFGIPCRHPPLSLIERTPSLG
jgi:hypothetical protein